MKAMASRLDRKEYTMNEENGDDHPLQGTVRMDEMENQEPFNLTKKEAECITEVRDQASYTRTFPEEESTSADAPVGAEELKEVDMDRSGEDNDVSSSATIDQTQDQIDAPIDQPEPPMEDALGATSKHSELALAQSAIVESGPQTPNPSQETRESSALSTISPLILPPNKLPEQDGPLPPIILSLPIDSLHCIASFLSPGEWTSFGQSGKGAGRVCREVFRRVRMHGFRCATEVVTAWKLGEQGDARELAALYIDSGVPIYPHSLGHSYHTLNWRMGVEATEAQRAATQEVDDNDAVNNHGSAVESTSRRRAVDRFYSERYEARARESYNENLTYLEEKCLFWLSQESEERDIGSFASNVRRQLSLTPNRLAARPLPGFRHVGQNGGGFDGGIVAPPPRVPARMNSGRITSPQSNVSSIQLTLHRSNSQADMRLHSPKVLVRLHRHLLDQHLLGRPSVDDGDGVMKTPAVSLSADFFHPHFTLRPNNDRHQPPTSVTTARLATNDGYVSGDIVSTWNTHLNSSSPAVRIENIGNAISNGLDPPAMDVPVVMPVPNPRSSLDGVAGTEDTDSENETDAGHQNLIPNAPPALELAASHVVPHPAPRQLVPPPEIVPESPPSNADPHLVLSNVDLEVYSATSSSPNMSVEGMSRREVKLHLQTRFEVYHKRLETLLAQNDSVSFEECILDFWDEFFPQTKYIHYYDRHTAVPRISCLHKFLTQPCPKSIGIVQCEIERIKLHSKKKGVNMKGRFFPTYEYRLFLRHRAPEVVDGDSQEPPRRDTVVMIAKNRGRKHFESSGSAHVASGSKKGANNYFLYMPQQADVDDHFNSVNGVEEPSINTQNGAASCPISSGDSSILLGRLQSNFIGTEFQIFSPRSRKQPPGRSFGRTIAGHSSGMSSDEDLDYDSGVCSDNASSSRRRSRSRGRFSRLSLRRSSLSIPGEEVSGDEAETLDSMNPAARTIRRTRSSSDVLYSRPSRTSRRAISNAADAAELQRRHPSLLEEEDGAITYTANLLGSRPRIMDVCIPKISMEGSAGSEWKKYLENCDDTDGTSPNRMLNRFKQLQQRLENEEQGNPTNNGEERSPTHESGEGYTPPDDFGLLVLQNRPPWWNIELGSFVLNFGGRVSVASVKNFQLCDPNDQDYIMLQFGRIQGRHSFTMDFQYPLTAVQAFAIAISSLQSKISFG